MRKISGVSLIIAGAMMFSFSAYLLINYMTAIEKIKGHIERSGVDTRFEQGVYNGKVATGILMLISTGVLLGGYRLKNKKFVH